MPPDVRCCPAIKQGLSLWQAPKGVCVASHAIAALAQWQCLHICRLHVGKDLCWALKASSAGSMPLTGTASEKGTDRCAADCIGGVVLVTVTEVQLAVSLQPQAVYPNTSGTRRECLRLALAAGPM